MTKIPLGERIDQRRARETADERYEAAAQAMLKALEEIKRCNEHYNFGSKLLRIVLPAIAAAKAAGITTGEKS